MGVYVYCVRARARVGLCVSARVCVVWLSENVCACVRVCVFIYVCACMFVGFVMCGCCGNVYTVPCLRFFLP